MPAREVLRFVSVQAWSGSPRVGSDRLWTLASFGSVPPVSCVSGLLRLLLWTGRASKTRGTEPLSPLTS